MSHEIQDDWEPVVIRLDQIEDRPPFEYHELPVTGKVTAIYKKIKNQHFFRLLGLEPGGRDYEANEDSIKHLMQKVWSSQKLTDQLNEILNQVNAQRQEG
jgi:hypothetical protein